jgi:hypothetical protein
VCGLSHWATSCSNLCIWICRGFVGCKILLEKPIQALVGGFGNSTYLPTSSRVPGVACGVLCHQACLHSGSRIGAPAMVGPLGFRYVPCERKLDIVEEAAAVLGRGAYAEMASSKTFEGHDGCGAAAATAEIEDLVMIHEGQGSIFRSFPFLCFATDFSNGATKRLSS